MRPRAAARPCRGTAREPQQLRYPSSIPVGALTVTVRSGARRTSYPIRIGRGLAGNLGRALAGLVGAGLFLYRLI